MNTLKLFSIVALSILLFNSCYYDSEEKLYGTTCTSASSNPSYATEIAPIISDNCYSCHNTSNAPVSGNSIDLQGYDKLSNYITGNKSVFLASINHTSGAEAMPKGGSKLSTCSIALIQNWVTNNMPNN